MIWARKNDYARWNRESYAMRKRIVFGNIYNESIRHIDNLAKTCIMHLYSQYEYS
jgi:hypothetical protein